MYLYAYVYLFTRDRSIGSRVFRAAETGERRPDDERRALGGTGIVRVRGYRARERERKKNNTIIRTGVLTTTGRAGQAGRSGIVTVYVVARTTVVAAHQSAGGRVAAGVYLRGRTCVSASVCARASVVRGDIVCVRSS